MNSKRNTLKNKLNVLVDTSFLLPALGLAVEEEVLRAVKQFHKHKIHYLEVSLLEVLWKIAKIMQLNKLDRVKNGIEAIRETYILVHPPSDSFVYAIKLYHDGHKDYIDNLLYSTSLSLRLAFLTNDLELIGFLKGRRLTTENILIPLSLKKIEMAMLADPTNSSQATNGDQHSLGMMRNVNKS